MEQKGMTVAIILLIVGLGVGYGIGQYTAPVREVEVEVPVEKPVYPLSGEIPIGVVGATDTTVKYYAPLINHFEPAINDYIKSLGHDFHLKFYLENAANSPTTCLEKIQSFDAMGIKVVIGMMYSSQIKASIDYVNEHKIVVISDHSTAPALAIPDDYVYRLCPIDEMRGPVMNAMLKDLGIEAVVAIQRGDAWGDGMYEAFKENYYGDIVERIRYSFEAKEFSAELAVANDKIKEAIDTYGEDKVGLQMFAFSDESLILLPAAENYPALLKVPWFNGELASRVIEVGDLAAETKWISAVDAPTRGEKYKEFAEMYREELAEEPTVWYTNFYDSAWIVAKAILNTASYDGEALKEAIPIVGNDYFGYSGWCRLNEAGDRPSDYDIQMVQKVEGEIKYVIVGSYSPATGTVKWSVPLEEIKG